MIIDINKKIPNYLDYLRDKDEDSISEVGGEKGVLQWWILEKKSLFAGLKSVS